MLVNDFHPGVDCFANGVLRLVKDNILNHASLTGAIINALTGRCSQFGQLVVQVVAGRGGIDHIASAGNNRDIDQVVVSG